MKIKILRKRHLFIYLFYFRVTVREEHINGIITQKDINEAGF
jgi:hypothetical protein